MTNNDEKIDIGLKAITSAIETHGKKVDSKFEKINMIMEARLDIINERITEVIEIIYDKKFDDRTPEPTATNHRGNNTVGPGIIKKKEEPIIIKKRPNAKKLSVNGKIPDSYKISGTACKYCQGTVAWAPFKKPSDLGPDEKREPPIHCDENGNIKGDGRCPNF